METSFFLPRLVRASAGTGKTFQLTNRYLGLLARGEVPERILATTFTRKAAGEIQERVFQRLAEVASGAKDPSELGDHIGLPNFTSQRALELLENLVQRQHSLRVCTLDSFFIQIAKCFCLELGLSPDWRILDEAVQWQCCREAVRELCRHPDSDEFMELMRFLNRGDSNRSVQENIESQIGGLYNLYLESEPQSWEWLTYPESVPKERITELIAKLAKVEVPRNKSGKPDKRWEKAIGRGVELVGNESWLGFIKSGIAAALLRDSEEPRFYNTLVPDEIRDLYSPLINQARAFLLKELTLQTRASAHLLELYDREFVLAKQRRGGMLFDDVKRGLSDASLLGNLNDVYFRLDGAIAHLLLDEFQDTSRIEWNILEPIADEIMSKAGEEHIFFCVGDVKQAIYGWRGGVAQIFHSLEQRWDQLDQISLSKSYRSAQPVIDTVNKVFHEISSNPALSEIASAAELWSAGFETHETDLAHAPGFVRLEVFDTFEGEDGKERYDLVDETVRRVSELLSQNSSLEIGILLRKNSDIASLLFGLTEQGIAASGEGGNALTNSPAVMLMLSLLTLAEHPGNTVSSFHVSHSPLGHDLDFRDHRNRSSRRRVSSEVRRMILERGYGSTLSHYAQMLFHYCGATDQRRLEQLVQLGFLVDERPPPRIRQFIELVELKKVESHNPANVRVMTIHRSKGLEFDAVILPELDQNLVDIRRDKVMRRRLNPLQAPDRIIRSAPREVRALDPRLEEMYEQEVWRNVQEELSVLYVALTRARHGLYMLIPPPSASDKYSCSGAGVLRAALAPAGEALPGAVLYERGDASWMKGHCPAEELNPAIADETVIESLKFVSSQRRKRGLPRGTPSGQEGSREVLISQLLGAGDSSAAKRGTMIHRLCEFIEWIPEDGLDESELEKKLSGTGSFDRGSIQEAVHEFAAMMSALPIKNLFMESTYEGITQVERELPFAIREGDSITTGIIDRLVISEIEKGEKVATVIDFKTDRLPAGDSQLLEERVEYYRPQLEAYSRAVTRYIGAGLKEFSLQLAFLSIGEVITL